MICFDLIYTFYTIVSVSLAASSYTFCKFKCGMTLGCVSHYQTYDSISKNILVSLLASYLAFLGVKVSFVTIS